MALFKILKGPLKNLDATPKTEGHACEGHVPGTGDTDP